MKKALKKRQGRGQRNLQLYDCPCTCSECGGCGSVPVNDVQNVRTGKSNNIYYNMYKIYNP